jgi:tetratricopeptide (TPR) repeat protein
LHLLGRSERGDRWLLRLLRWSVAPRRETLRWQAVRAIQFAYFWHDIRQCRRLALVQLALASEPQQLRASLAWFAYALAYAGHRRGLVLLRRVLYQAHRAGDRALLVETYPLLAIGHHMTGDPARATFYHRWFLRHLAGENSFYRLLSLSSLLGVSFAQGDFLALRAAIDECFTCAFALDASRHHLQIYGWHAVLLAAEGRREEALGSLETAGCAARRADNHLDHLILARLAALTCYLLGAPGQALAHIETGMDHWRRYGAPRFYRNELLQLRTLARIALGAPPVGSARRRAEHAVRAAALWQSCARYASTRARQRRDASVETTFFRLGERLSLALAALDFAADRAPDSDALRDALQRVFSTRYVAMAADLDGLRRAVMEDLAVERLSVFEERRQELRLVVPGGGLFVGYQCPRTAELHEDLAVGVLLDDLDIVSESLLKAALRMILAQYVFVKAIRVSRERQVAEQRAAAIRMVLDLRQTRSVVIAARVKGCRGDTVCSGPGQKRARRRARASGWPRPAPCRPPLPRSPRESDTGCSHRPPRNVRDHTRLRHLFRPLAAGVRPVTGYEHLLAEVARCHMENVDVYERLCAITFSDDDFLHPDTLPDQGERSPSLFSPAFYADAIEGAGVPVFGVTGWYDGAYQHAAIRRFLQIRTPGSRLLIGPWHHGGKHNISPFRGPSSLPFDAALLLTDFFDHHLQGEAPPPISPVRYFTMGEERWKEADVWPPPGFSRECWYMTATHRLAPERPSSTGVHTQHVDPAAGTGHRSRWDSLLPLYVPADYPRRAERERDLAVYRSERLSAAMEVTGHPVVSIQLQTWLSDLFLFAYLEDEAPDGRIRHVTEGQLRALHRESHGVEATGVPLRTFRRDDGCPIEPGVVTELRFDLLPTSWLFAPGHRLRLALSGADRDHFADATPGDFAIQIGGEHASYIELPVRRR